MRFAWADRGACMLLGSERQLGCSFLGRVLGDVIINYCTMRVGAHQAMADDCGNNDDGIWACLLRLAADRRPSMSRMFLDRGKRYVCVCVRSMSVQHTYKAPTYRRPWMFPYMYLYVLYVHT